MESNVPTQQQVYQWNVVYAPVQQKVQTQHNNQYRNQFNNQQSTNVTTPKTLLNQLNQTIRLQTSLQHHNQLKLASSVSAFEKKVVELTNAERAKQGLAPLNFRYSIK